MPPSLRDLLLSMIESLYDVVSIVYDCFCEFVLKSLRRVAKF